MNDRKLIKKSDLLIIVMIVVVAAVFFMLRDRDVAAECAVSYNGTVVSRVRLDVPVSFTVEQAPDMVFEVKNGKVAAVRSDCPDQVCVNAGFIGHTGQSIVCIPNRIVVSLETGSESRDEPDMVAR